MVGGRMVGLPASLSCKFINITYREISAGVKLLSEVGREVAQSNNPAATLLSQ